MPPKSSLALMLAIGKKKPKSDSPDDSSKSLEQDSPPPEMGEGMGDEPDGDEMEHSEPDGDEGMKDENCIVPPKGFKPPPDVAGDGSFTGTFRGYVKDGKLYFSAINGIGMEGEKQEEDQGDEQGDDMHPMDKRAQDEQDFKKAFGQMR